MNSEKVKTLEGKICSNAKYAEGTLTVMVTRFFSHPMYKKKVKRVKKYIVHCESKKQYEMEAIVLITQCRPISKRKRWKIYEENK